MASTGFRLLRANCPKSLHDLALVEKNGLMDPKCQVSEAISTFTMRPATKAILSEQGLGAVVHRQLCKSKHVTGAVETGPQQS